jgi:glycosyltransferase involved in cell wall biosynthesis
MTTYVNARFRRRPTTGVERVATEVLARLSGPVVEIDPPSWAAGGPGGHLWEQAVLPGRAPGVLWSPCNTGPVRADRHVVTMHDTAPISNPEWFRRGFATTYGALVPRLCRRAEVVVTPSAPVADEVVALGVDRGRVRVIGNGVSERFRPADPAQIAGVRARFGLSERPYLVALGSPGPRKNFTRLLEAWRSARVGDALLVLIGRAAANVFQGVELPADATVVELGRVDDADLAPLLSGAVALVSPSIYEGFGLAPLEALACGTPVVVSDIAVHRCVLAPFDPVLVDPFDTTSITQGIESAVAEPRSVDSASVAASHSWSRAASDYDAVFDEVARQG